MKPASSLRLVAAGAIAITVAACSGQGQAPATAQGTTLPRAEGVTIGAIVPLSGEHASFGTTARAAFEIAEADAKRQGHSVPRLVYGDSKLDKDLTLKEFRRLVDQDKVVGFVEVTGSGPALALEEIAARDRVPIVSGIDTAPALTKGGGPYFFRVIASDAYSSRVLSQWAVGKGYQKAAIVVNQENDWATGFRDSVLAAYRSKGGQLADDAIINVTNDTVDFASAISRMKQQRPDALFVGLMGRQAGLFAKQAVDKGLTVPLLGVDNLAQQEFVDNAGPARTKAVLALPAESKSEGARRFEEAYRAKTSRDADAIAFKAYDSYWAVLRAVESVQKAGQPVTGEAVQKALATLRFDGITGPIAFDADNDLAQANYEQFTYDQKGTKIPLS